MKNNKSLKIYRILFRNRLRPTTKKDTTDFGIDADILYKNLPTVYIIHNI
jgi:hypothetical protein